MKTILFALLVVLASCSSEDPEPQVTCEQLNAEIEQVTRQIEAHYAKGAEGNQSAWEKESTRLINLKSTKVSEAKKRLC
jgi:hypothetical protein